MSNPFPLPKLLSSKRQAILAKKQALKDMRNDPDINTTCLFHEASILAFTARQ